MNPRKLRRHLNRLRNKAGSGLASAELERLAEALGRVRSKRGSEPTWVSELFPDLRPISIPHHSKPLARYTAMSILDSLELDLERIEED
jgi:hypothetical protein